ncbi:MAG: hypothetical protein IKW51_08635 [Bacteroidales bacterium]|nr:hypothetical protein [Bacteroidales bacterium]
MAKIMEWRAMSEEFKRFVETLQTQNTIKVVKSLQVIGDYNYLNCTPVDLEQIILSIKPNSPKAIITICYVMSLYAKYLGDNKLYQMIQNVDKNKLWLKAKPNASKKFISHSLFTEVYHDIGVYEEFNSFYYQTLFRCLYEGIYNDDMSVIKNLRASDIKDNIVVLHDDNGDCYELQISNELADGLRELAIYDVWERKNRNGICHIKLSGIHSDTCFKVEMRSRSDDSSYRYSYYRSLRKISKEYLEYNLLPLQLYVSGIMYRIELKLKEQNIDLEDAFATHNRDRIVSGIISNELQRCNFNTEVKNFRQMVKGHLDIFKY